MEIRAHELEPKAAASVAVVAWTLDLARIRDQIRREPGLVAMLGPSEHARAAHYANAALADLYVAAHVGMRIVLIQRCGTKIAGNDFSISPTGKPFLPDGPEFSFSRSGLIGLIAISENSSVGVDIERTTTPSVSRWSVRYPVLRLFAISADYDAPDAFLHAWVRLEAWCKRRGLALGTLLDSSEDEFLGNFEEFGPFRPGSELLQLNVLPDYLAWTACNTRGGILVRQLDL